ncbi:DNA repair protein RecO [Falsirhodobacter sp. 20TX0035]|uniref:DNA repair protein RecO n=1 Tax=Falsirhodobacter sp. 20TX0035 TaxID=3022019 RepID=UPI00232E1A07|nr:DNA repair protein RecO [Falsirhodobacter sp. 20TX0035]MDB6454595.1 DNA repair protein RecO [Falsirhodobacter sp. 20TX0035]
MEWRDEGALLSVRRHGESAAIIEVFTAAHGRHAGLVHGGASRRMAAMLQPGNQLDVTWRARLDDQLGTFHVEPLRSRSVLQDRLALAGLNAVCAMLRLLLPEREAHPALFAVTMRLLDDLGTADWGTDYLRWELRLMEEVGFGLDLTRCAVTGQADDLVFVSPRTGRAVSRAGAGDWADRLLPLPAVLLGQGGGAEGWREGFALTAHFLARALDRDLPEARSRLVDLLLRVASGGPKAEE